MIAVILIFPVIAAAVAFAFKRQTLDRALMLAYAIVHASATVLLILDPSGIPFLSNEWTPYFRTDALCILFLAVLSVVYLGTALYSMDFLSHANAGKWNTYYSMFIMLFVGAMSASILTTHLGVYWICVEASTLTSAALVYFYRTRTSLEATWKYLFICSIGIALAFIGIILLSAANLRTNSLFFSDLYADASSFPRLTLSLSFAFLVVGFGTKMGLAPMHNWLPDAHAEAPAPVSALLSATLLNTAFIGILRMKKLADLAHLERFASMMLFTMGFLSLFVSAVFIIRSRNFKRMLAYSSVEHMGILAIALATGGGALIAMFLHIIGHSLAKASYFLTAGTIYDTYGTKNINEVSGVVKRSPVTGWLWILSFVAAAAFPPFSTFISEFLIIKELFSRHIVFTLLFFALLTAILFGIASKTLAMAFGKSDEKPVRTPVARYAPQIVFLTIIAVLGLYLPPPLHDMLANAAQWLKAGLSTSLNGAMK